MMALNWGRIAAVAALLAMLSAGVWKIYHSGVVAGRAEVQAQWNVAKLAQNEADAKAEADSLTRERQLRTDADNIRRTKDEKITELNHTVAAALERLRKRPERPAQGNLPSDPAADPNAGCTGAGLYKSDGEFLIGESSRADLVLIDLAQCQGQYEAAFRAVNPP